MQDQFFGNNLSSKAMIDRPNDGQLFWATPVKLLTDANIIIIIIIIVMISIIKIIITIMMMITRLHWMRP